MGGGLWWLFLILILGLGLLQDYEVLSFLGLLLALGSLAAGLSFRYALHGVSYRRRLGQPCIFHGEQTDLVIEAANAKPIPLPWLLVQDRLPAGLSVLEERRDGQVFELTPSHLRDVLVLRPYEVARRSYRLRGTRRGVYDFDSVTLTAGSLFGLGHRQARLQHGDPSTGASRLVVYPRLVPVEGLKLPLERPAGEGAAQRRVIDDPLRLSGVRDYVPGDSPRYIHWKNTAHRGQLQTRTFDPAASPVLALFVDLQTAADPYTVVPEYLELLLTAAASIAIHALEARVAVGLAANGGPAGTEQWTVVPPGRHAEQGARILQALAPLEGVRTLSLPQLLYRARHALPHGSMLPYGSTVLVLTAHTTEPVLLSLLRLQDKGHPAVLLTVGEQRPFVPPSFAHHYLGGRDAWHRLETLALA